MSAWKTDSCDKLRQGDVHGLFKKTNTRYVNEKSLSLQVLFKKSSDALSRHFILSSFVLG
jgi:hypothetical protein